MRALAAALLLVALAAAPAAAADAMRQTGSFTDCDEVKTAEFVAAADAVDPKFEASVRARRGWIGVKIVRPDGTVETEVSTDDEWTFSIDPEALRSRPGTWRVEITAKRATGTYEMRYTTGQ